MSQKTITLQININETTRDRILVVQSQVVSSALSRIRNILSKTPVDMLVLQEAREALDSELNSYIEFCRLDFEEKFCSQGTGHKAEKDSYSEPKEKVEDKINILRGKSPKDHFCSNCAYAMRAINGLTCKKTCDGVGRLHTCKDWAHGKPIGV